MTTILIEPTLTQNIKISEFQTFGGMRKQSINQEPPSPMTVTKVPEENEATEPYVFGHLVKKGPFMKNLPPLIVLVDSDNSFQRQFTFDSPLNAHNKNEEKSPRSGGSSANSSNPFRTNRGFPRPSIQTQDSPRQSKPSPRAFLQSPKNNSPSRRKASADSIFSSTSPTKPRRTSHK